MPQPRDPTPRTPLRLVRMLWLVWAILSILGISAGFYTLADRITVASSHAYAGTLTPDQDPTIISLPSGLPLESVLVEPGETVKVGQTLALLDTAAMAEHLAQTRREISVAGVLRECLLGTEFNAESRMAPLDLAGSGDEETSVAEYDSETGILMRTALEDCRATQEADILQQIRLQQGLSLLRTRLELIDQKLAMVLAASEKNTRRNGVNPVARAHASVSISLEKNQLLGRFQTLQTELRALKIDQNRARLARIHQLSEGVARKLTLQALLTHYLAAPRLQAPENGTVNRIRPVLIGQTYTGDENLIELRGVNAGQYRAEMQMPFADYKSVRPGTVVDIRLAGFSDNGPRLKGRVSGVSQGQNILGARQITAQIELSAQSQALLADPVQGVALHGQSTASSIRVEAPTKSLRALLTEATVQVFDHLWAGNDLHIQALSDRSQSDL